MRAAVVTVCRIDDCKRDRQLALHQATVSASDQLKQPNDEADLFMQAGAQEGWAGHRCLTPRACRRRSRDDVGAANGRGPAVFGCGFVHASSCINGPEEAASSLFGEQALQDV